MPSSSNFKYQTSNYIPLTLLPADEGEEGRQMPL
jgi:hypothetical protein